MEIIDKLEVIKNRWEEIADQMNDPEVMLDMKRYVKLNKDYKDLEPLITAYKNTNHLLLIFLVQTKYLKPKKILISGKWQEMRSKS